MFLRIDNNIYIYIINVMMNTLNYVMKIKKIN